MVSEYSHAFVKPCQNETTVCIIICVYQLTSYIPYWINDHGLPFWITDRSVFRSSHVLVFRCLHSVQKGLFQVHLVSRLFAIGRMTMVSMVTDGLPPASRD